MCFVFQQTLPYSILLLTFLVTFPSYCIFEKRKTAVWRFRNFTSLDAMWHPVIIRYHTFETMISLELWVFCASLSLSFINTKSTASSTVSGVPELQCSLNYLAQCKKTKRHTIELPGHAWTQFHGNSKLALELETMWAISETSGSQKIQKDNLGRCHRLAHIFTVRKWCMVNLWGIACRKSCVHTGIN